MSTKELENLLSKTLGKKLSKKAGKKLKLKYTGPILMALFGLIAQFIERFFSSPGREQSAPPPPPTSTPRRAAPGLEPALQAQLDRARAYQAELDRLAQSQTTASNSQRLAELAAHMRQWTEAIEALVQRVNGYRQNPLIRQDLKQVPQAIERLESRLAGETDPLVRTELARALDNRRQQQQSLTALNQTMQRAEIKIENTLSLLGTLYSQVLAGQSKDHVANYRRILANVDEEVHTLQDYLSALDEVKFGQMAVG